jgi:hypothetical protein
MRGADHQQNHMFSYLSPEMRVRKDHPLPAIRNMVDEVLAQLSRRFDSMYASVGRPSIPLEKLLRAPLLQMLYSIRSGTLVSACIVAQLGALQGVPTYAIEFVEQDNKAKDFWGITFPSNTQ